jgi:hypothetical protein
MITAIFREINHIFKSHAENAEVKIQGMIPIENRFHVTDITACLN